MTFNLEWATAPESGGFTGRYDSNVISTAADGSVSFYPITHYEGPGYFNANNAVWWWLVDQMDERGMLSGTDRRLNLGIPFHKLSSNDGAHVLPEEVMEALLCLRLIHERPPADFADEDDPEDCSRLWNEWIWWITEAANTTASE